MHHIQIVLHLSELLLPFTELASTGEINTEESHDAVHNHDFKVFVLREANGAFVNELHLRRYEYMQRRPASTSYETT